MNINNNIKLKKTVETLIPNNGSVWGTDVIHTWDLVSDGIYLLYFPVTILYKIMASQTNGAQEPPDLAFDYGENKTLLFHSSVFLSSGNPCTDIPVGKFLYYPEEQGITISEIQVQFNTGLESYDLVANGNIDGGTGLDLLFTVYSEIYYGIDTTI